MSRLIGTLGYIGRPEFAYDCPPDRSQIESMLAARDDRILMAHWDDLDAESLVTQAWDIRTERWVTEDFSQCAAFLILEAPIPGSKNADFVHVEAAMREILRRGIPAVNSVRTFLEYPDKRYLVDRPDMPFPRTALVTTTTDLQPILADLPDTVVLKPIIGCSGKGVVRLPRDEVAVRNAMEPGREYLLQPFLPEILEGERSLYFFAKRYRYATIKRPKPGEFRGNEEFAVSDRYEPTPDELAFAEDALARFGSPSLIERVDMCGRHILEMTIECPGLKIRKCGVEQEVGPWTFEAIDMAIAGQ
jgi:hypothetical protein